jgi:hypothetical protein
VGITVTGEGRIITFAMASEVEVEKLKIVEGTDAWHYHNNSFYSDCVLEIEGLPRMHASAGEADTAPVVIRRDPRDDSHQFVSKLFTPPSTVVQHRLS